MCSHLPLMTCTFVGVDVSLYIKTLWMTPTDEPFHYIT